MEDVIALINRIIDEHKVIARRARALERTANDVEALGQLEEAKESFMPGRLDQKQGLNKLEELLEETEIGLESHFKREETGLLDAFEKYGSRELVSGLITLLREHKDIRSRLAHSKKHIAELTTGDLGRHKWEASAHDMRAHMSHTVKVLGKHAHSEMELLIKIRRRLNKAAKEVGK